MSDEDPGYQQVLGDEYTHHEAHKASFRRAVARGTTFALGLALIVLPIYALSNGRKDGYDDLAKSMVAIAAPVGAALMSGSAKGSAAAALKDVTTIGT